MKKRSMARALAAMLMVGGLLTAVLATGGTAGAADPTYRYDWNTRCASSVYTISFGLLGGIGNQGGGGGGGGELSLPYRLPCNGAATPQELAILTADITWNEGRIVTAFGGTDAARDIANRIATMLTGSGGEAPLGEQIAKGLPIRLQGNHIDYGWWSWWTGIFSFGGIATLRGGASQSINTTWMGLNGAFYTNPGTFGFWGGDGEGAGAITDTLDAFGAAGCGYGQLSGIDGGASSTAINTRWMTVATAACGFAFISTEGLALGLGGMSVDYKANIVNA